MIGTRARSFALMTLFVGACSTGTDPGGAEYASSQQAATAITGVTCPSTMSFGAVCTYTPGLVDDVTHHDQFNQNKVYPSVFQIVGPNPSDAAGTRQGNEVAETFTVPRFGRPGSVNLILRRISKITNPAAHDLIVDMIQVPPSGVVPIPPSLPPPSCGAGGYSYIARGRFDTSLLTFGVDTPVTVNFISDSTITLDPNLMYALYMHIESPGVDRVGVAGTEFDTYVNGGPFNRQMRVTGPTCLSNPVWIGVAARDVNMAITLDNGCTIGNVINCGQGICSRTVPQCDNYGVINSCIPGGCQTDADCCPVATDPNTGNQIDCSSYTCNGATGLCNTHSEVCNGVDDNCDGLTDNGLPLTALCGSGPCQRAVYPCDNAGHVVACTPDFSKASAESCNNIDDDCNGSVDDGLPNPSCGTGLCFRNVYSCQNGMTVACTPDFTKRTTESCDGRDEDCDGFLDNATTGNAAKLTQPYWPGTAGTRHVGACTDGVQTCSASAMAPGVPQWTTTTNPVLPVTDTCNALDDDCDGFVDNIGGGVATKLTRSYYNGAMNTRGVGRCQDGVQTCGVNASAGQWGVTTTDVEPVSEICNGVDDNCDGMVDNGLGSVTCGLGVCQVSIQNCVNGVSQQCTPTGQPASAQGDQTKKTAESCNNTDDDCDGFVDNKVGISANNTLAQNCSPQAQAFSGAIVDTGICQHGTSTCTSGTWGSCVGEVPPVAEKCNNLDDNCNGTVDDPSALSSMCPTPPHAVTVTCTGSLATNGRTTGCWLNTTTANNSACAANFYDVNGHNLADGSGHIEAGSAAAESAWADGCECADDAYATASPSNTSSSTCVAGKDVGSFAAGQSTTVTGNIPVNTLTDYYVAHFPITADFLQHGTGTINISLPRTRTTTSSSSSCRARAAAGRPTVSARQGRRRRSSCSPTATIRRPRRRTTTRAAMCGRRTCTSR